MLGEVEGARAALHRPVEKQMTFVHLNSRKVIIKDVGPCKGWTSNKAPGLVFLVYADEVFHRLPTYRFVHQLIGVFFEVRASLPSKPDVHHDVGLHPRGSA